MYDDILEVILRKAVTENLDDEINALEAEIDREGSFVFSDRHKRRMKKLFFRVRRQETLSSLSKWGKRVAVSILILAVLLFGALMTVQEVRAIIVETVVEWYDKFTQFVFRSDMDTASLVTHWEITELPDGYVLIDSSYGEGMSYADYAKDSTGDIISFEYSDAGELSISVNNEDLGYSSKTSKGIVYHFFISDTADAFNKLIWDRENYRFVIRSTLGQNELLKMAESVSEKNIS
jgi:hypothetical protein